MGKELELHLEKLLKFDSAKRSKSSGASFHDNIDVTSEHFVFECEATEKKSYGLKREFWEEVRGKAYNNKIPALCFRFRNTKNPRKSVDLIALDINDFVALMEKIYEKDENV